MKLFVFTLLMLSCLHVYFIFNKVDAAMSPVELDAQLRIQQIYNNLDTLEQEVDQLISDSEIQSEMYGEIYNLKTRVERLRPKDESDWVYSHFWLDTSYHELLQNLDNHKISLRSTLE